MNHTLHAKRMAAFLLLANSALISACPPEDDDEQNDAGSQSPDDTHDSGTDPNQHPDAGQLDSSVPGDDASTDAQAPNTGDGDGDAGIDAATGGGDGDAGSDAGCTGAACA